MEEGGERDASHARYVMFVGQSIEKREIEPILKSIENDAEMRRLITEPRRLRKYWIPLNLILAILIPIFTFALTLKFSTYGVLAGILISVLFGIALFVVILILERLDRNLYYWHLKRPGEEFPLGPFDMWRPEAAGISDAYGAIAAQKMGKDAILVHSNEPYFNRFFIYSITLEFKGPANKHTTAGKIYEREFKQYARNVVKLARERKRLMEAGIASGKEVSHKELDEVSWQVFGISFLSLLLLRYSRENRCELIFSIPDDFTVFRGKEMFSASSKDGAETAKKVAACVKELIDLSTPSDSRWENPGNEESGCLVIIRSAEVMQKRADETSEKLFCVPVAGNKRRSNTITIPVRRWVNVPKVETGWRDEWSSAFRFLESLAGKETGDVTYVGVGGAEHNLAMLYFINRFRREDQRNSWIKLAENRFDSEDPGGSIMLYTERRVGFRIRDRVYGAGKDENTAVLLRFTIHEYGAREFRFAYFFGLGGAMTNIALLRYLSNPDIARGDGAYIFTAGRGSFKEFLKRWDAADPMNNPTSQEVSDLLKEVTVERCET
ncbi:MAG: hypothetical protein ACP5UO_05595 [Thermoplasmata archaeon]